MDEQLYRMIMQGGQSARVPEAGSAFAAALDATAMREAQLQLKHRADHDARLDDLANQGMFEQYLTQGSAFAPHELGTGTMRDRRTLGGGAPAQASAHSEASAAPNAEAEFDKAWEEAGPNAGVTPAKYALQSAFSRAGRPPDEGGRPVLEVQGANFVDDSPGVRAGGKNGVNREVMSSKGRTGKGYAPQRTEAGRKAMDSMRETVLKERESTARTSMTQAEKAREAELQAATKLTIRSMQDAAAMARQRQKIGKGPDRAKELAKGLQLAQSRLAAMQKHADGLKGTGFANSETVADADRTIAIWEEEVKSWAEAYDTEVRGGKGSAKGGGSAKPETRTTPDGKKWQKVQGGWQEM